MSAKLRASERGAVLIHAGIAMIALMAFSALSVDYGVMWVGRRQAQNAADATALAGAYSLAFVDSSVGTGYALARTRAVLVGSQNAVWGAAPVISTATDVLIGPCAALAPGAPPAGPTTCVSATVHRDAASGNPLPTFFAQLVGVTSQSITATAVAQVVPGTEVNCLKPWALPDKWLDLRDAPQDNEWTWDDEFDKYDNHGNLLPGVVDLYTPPNATTGDPGTGFRVPEDVGIQVRIKPQDPHESIVASSFFPVRLPGNTGGDDYREAIAGCHGGPVSRGMVLDTENGNMVGPTRQGVDDLIALDPGASWVGGVGGHIEGSCAPSCAAQSPRIVPIPMFNADQYLATAYGSGKHEITVTQILGFFVEGFQGNDLLGRFMQIPGELAPGVPIPPGTSSFLSVVRLVR